MLNHIVIMGRLPRDPELRRTQTGTAVASFSVAVERDFGEKTADFIDCVAWRNTAEFINSYFAKGQMIVVSGRLQVRDFNDKSGARRKAVEVVVGNVYFGEPKREGRTAPAADDWGIYAPAQASDFYDMEDEDGEFPF